MSTNKEMDESTMKHPHNGETCNHEKRMRKTPIYQYGVIFRMVLNEKEQIVEQVYSILLFVKEKQEDNTYLPIIAKKME